MRIIKNIIKKALFIEGSAHTIVAARLSRSTNRKGDSEKFEVRLSDESVLTGEIDQSEKPLPKGNILLVHGLGSSCHDHSVVRQSKYLASTGFRVFRLNHRNSGSGKGKAKGFYHADRGEDILEALTILSSRYKFEKWVLIGQSISGNMALKLNGDEATQQKLVDANCVGVIALSPIIDLASSSKQMLCHANGIFDKIFTYKIKSYLKDIDSIPLELKKIAQDAKSLYDLDSSFVAPALGLSSATEYHTKASAEKYLPSQLIPVEIFLAKDDPIAPNTEKILKKQRYSNLKLNLTIFGGHLGFVNFNLLKFKIEFLLDKKVAISCDRFLKI